MFKYTKKGIRLMTVLYMSIRKKQQSEQLFVDVCSCFFLFVGVCYKCSIHRKSGYLVQYHYYVDVSHSLYGFELHNIDRTCAWRGVSRWNNENNKFITDTTWYLYYLQ